MIQKDNSGATSERIVRFGSVCSGIEAASVAFAPMGFEAAWFSEIEPFPVAILAHHYPDVKNHGDMTTLPEDILLGEVEAPDILCGGTPCQAFSVAGLRNSLEDARGNLSLIFCEVANAIDAVRAARGEQPAIVFWENVCGVLNTKDNAFGCFLAGLAGESVPLVAPGGKWPNAGVVVGPQRNLAWRVLDAQYFGLAQRRKRVFVVASARDGFDPARVLFESEGVRRDSPQSRDAGQGVAGTVANCLRARSNASHRPDTDNYVDCGHLLTTAFQSVDYAGDASVEMSPTLRRHDPMAVAYSFDALNSNPQPGDPCHTIAKGSHAPLLTSTLTGNGDAHSGFRDANGLVAYALQANTIGRQPHNGGNGLGFAPELAPELAPTLTGTDRHGVATGIAPSLMATLCALDDAKWGSNQWVKEGKAILQQSQVRRLTPVECERLMGYGDNYTRIPWRGKQASDCPHGPRYKALGNSWAVPVVRWIGWRIWAELNT